jgi:hypothetical protein
MMIVDQRGVAVERILRQLSEGSGRPKLEATIP